MPWWEKLEQIVAPTEQAANIAIAAIIIVGLLVLWKGTPLMKAAYAVYMLSP